jgi:hypothetical protein
MIVRTDACYIRALISLHILETVETWRELTYCFLGGIIVHDASVLHSEGQGVIPRSVQQVRKRRHEAVQYHRVDSQSNPSRSVTPASVVAQDDGHEQLADIITHGDDSCASHHTIYTFTVSLFWNLLAFNIKRSFYVSLRTNSPVAGIGDSTQLIP